MFGKISLSLAAVFILRNSFIQSFYSDDVALENGACDNEYTFLIERQLHF
jgi:hypothetical protein